MMNVFHDLSQLKRIPIIEVARRLGIQVHGTKAMCFSGHDRATPSLSFLIAKNTWRCFGACGKYGDTIALVMEKEHLDFKSALGWFADQFGVDVRTFGNGRSKSPSLGSKMPIEQTSVDPIGEAIFVADSELYSWLVDNCPPVSSKQGNDYLKAHGISQETATRFYLREIIEPETLFCRLADKWGTKRLYRSGIAWGEHRQAERLIWEKPALLIPFHQNAVTVYLQARMFAGHRKYLNPRGIAKPMFNADRLSTLPSDSVIHICEGVPDALALETHGLAAVGVLGATSFRAEWVEPFNKFDVVVLEQGDNAGEKFTTTISSFFRTRGKSVRCLKLPKGKDAADVLAAGKNI
jgi:DNA primase